MVTAMSGAIINVILNFVMIPDHGAMGAAVATLISYVAVYTVRAIDTKRFIAFDLKMTKLLANPPLHPTNKKMHHRYNQNEFHQPTIPYI